MSWDIAELAAPLFVDGNYVNRDADAAGGIEMSHANALRARLYDMARESFIDLAGSEGEGTQIEIKGKIYDEGAPISRQGDYFHILNHNWAAFTIELSTDGGFNYGTPISRTGLTAPDTIVVLDSPQTFNAWRIRATTTQAGAGGSKQIGGLIIGKVRMQPRVGMSLLDPVEDINVVEDRMGNGTTRRAYIYHADGSYKMRTIGVGFTGLTRDEAQEFEEKLLDNPLPFIFVPEPGDDPTLAHLCEIVPGSWGKKYLSLRKSAGKTVTFDLQEKGGA